MFIGVISYNHVMNKVTEPDKRNRRTYSLAPDRASDLIRVQLDIETELKRSVYRQDVLDAMVKVMASDPGVYKKVLNVLR